MTTATAPKKGTLDAALIEQEESEKVRAILDPITDDAELVEASAKIINADADLFRELGRRRDNLMLSLVLHDCESGLTAARLGGVSRSMLTKILRERVGGGEPYRLTEKSADDMASDAKAAKVYRIRNAEGELVEIGEQIARSRARADAARMYRDPAVRRVVEGGVMSAAEVSRLIGTNHTAVSHILSGRSTRTAG